MAAMTPAEASMLSKAVWAALRFDYSKYFPSADLHVIESVHQIALAGIGGFGHCDQLVERLYGSWKHEYWIQDKSGLHPFVPMPLFDYLREVQFLGVKSPLAYFEYRRLAFARAPEFPCGTPFAPKVAYALAVRDLAALDALVIVYFGAIPHDSHYDPQTLRWLGDGS
jgi:hypothetical protein